MAFINTTYPPFTEDPLGWLGGVARTILGTGGKFSAGRFSFWNQMNPRVVMVDVSWGELMAVAQNVPHLNVVISKGAEMFANMEMHHLDKDGKRILNSPIEKFLNNPNFLQTQDSFAYEWYIMHAVYNCNFMYANRGSALAETPRFLWNLPSGKIKINLTGKHYRQTEVKGVIENYVLTGDPQPFLPDEIIHITQGISFNGVNAESRIKGLEIPLSNIMAALKSNNIILTERGLIGFISSEGKGDSDGALPMDKKEKERVEKDYQERRSLDSTKGHVTFSSAAIKWVPMTFDVGQLKLFEGLEDAFANICGAYGVDRDIFPSTKGATNENKKQGEVRTYQSTMLPLAKKYANALAKYLKLEDKGERLMPSYAQLPIMQENDQEKAAALASRAATVASLVQANVINPSQAKVILTMLTAIEVDPSLENKNAVVAALMQLSPLVANNVLGNMTINEVRTALLNLPEITGGDALAKLATTKPESGGASGSGTGGAN